MLVRVEQVLTGEWNDLLEMPSQLSIAFKHAAFKQL